MSVKVESIETNKIQLTIDVTAEEEFKYHSKRMLQKQIFLDSVKERFHSLCL
ncbi:MAG: hypothetical protein K0R18_2647 [Bacillales bacterium]|nr:hypothetical protein [Bacillales bacterium]